MRRTIWTLPVSTAPLKLVLALPVAAWLAVSSVTAPAAAGSANGAEPTPPALLNISVGHGATCAVLSGGSVACWGVRWLGNGTPYASVIPQITLLDQSATQVANGEQHACALLEDATVSCWGDNSSNEVGDWATLGGEVLEPTAVPDVDHVVSLAAGGAHTCAVRDDGTAWCWGYGGSGQLGSPDLFKEPPTQVPGITDAVAVAAGDWHTCLLRDGGTVSCFGYWGPNEDGDVVQHFSPLAIEGFDGVTALSSGADHTCGLIDDGTVRCFGRNPNGQLGNGTTAISDSAVAVDNLENVVAIGTGTAHTCAVRAAGGVFCWGSNYGGQLGFPDDEDDQLVPRKVDGISGASAVDGGQGFTCAIVAGVGTCWGRNESGQLGDRTFVSRSQPQPISWVPDTDAPTAASPVVRIRVTNKALYGDFIRTKVEVPADDGVDGTGIDHIEVRFSKDGGATWGRTKWRSEATWSKKLKTEGTIIAEARAIDGVGNASEWVTSPVWTPRMWQEDSPAISYDGAWQTVDSGTYSGGAAAYTTSDGASATITFTGRSFGIVSRKGPARGEFRVFVDGQAVGIVDLRSAEQHRYVVVFARHWATSEEHTIRIVALGTTGRPRVDLDAFVVIG
jgi:hypothetical protein